MEKKTWDSPRGFTQAFESPLTKENICLFEQLWQEIFQTSPVGAHLSTNL